MKTLRYLLIASLIMLPIVGAAQEAFDFRSTSAMQGSGTGIQTAAESGVILSGNTPNDGVSAGIGHFGSSRRATMEDDPFGGETIDDTGDPLEPGTPIGDGMWVMMVMAVGYLIYRVRTRKREVMA